ncbi:hypothetical protein [Alistipes onderdonkii]|jgi:hypothetical protein|uniref:Uncharacterized protein n=1 Tax=Alistipes onderdonkii TaxID=328813 RepID=A0A1Y3QR76_9BACT|nr:hypothetical protein [Alistipes onderdonkii]OUN02153.1 hypothetical protein B5G41_12365 [Alistipes onderdonkii]
MPEFNFRLSDAEMDDVIDYIFAKGVYMAPDDSYTTPDAKYIHSKEEYAEYEKDKITLKIFVMHDNYVECPLMYGSFIKNGQKLYYIQDREGGPHIQLLWFKRVNSGLWTYYPYYFYETVDYYKQRPPEALIRLYKEIVKYIQKKCVVIKYYGSRKYCGKEYLNQIRDGLITQVDDEFKELVLKHFEK